MKLSVFARRRQIFLCVGAVWLLVVPAIAAAQPASCSNFADSPLTSGVPIRALHFNQLRTCINDLRSQRGLSQAAWSEPIVAGQTAPKAIHVNELRSAVTAVYQQLNLTAPAFGPDIAQGQIMAVAHLIALRDAVAGVPACAFQVSPTNVAPPGTPSEVLISVTTNGCQWSSSEETEFASFVSTAAVVGSGMTTLQVVANTTTAPRAFTVVVAGVSVSLVQARAPCTFQVSPTNSNVASGAAQVSFSITTNDCDWTASENSSFAGFSATEGSGNGSTALGLDANPSIQPRTVNATIAGISVSVTQAGLPCTPSLSPASVTIDPLEQNGSFGLSIPAGCSWTTSSNASWLVPSDSSGSGGATVQFTVAANAGLERTGTIAIAGTTFAVTQTVGCSPVFETTVLTATTASMQVTTGPGCQWEATPTWNQVTVTPTSGEGSGEAIIQIPEPTDPSYLSEIQIEYGNPSAGTTGSPTIQLPCIDSRSILCRIIIGIILPGGSLQGPPQGAPPPQKVSEEVTVVRDGPQITVGLAANTGDGATISGWRFDSDDGTVQIIRQSNQGGRFWTGKMVKSGTVSVNAMWKGKPYPLHTHVTATARTGWGATAPSSEPRQIGWVTVAGHPLNLLSPLPWEEGGSGVASPSVVPNLGEGNVGQVTDNGPNRDVRFLLSAPTTNAFDWLLHPDVADLSSPFAQAQLGDWAGTASCISAGLDGDGNGRSIRRDVYRDGVARHEGGDINSHFALFKAALLDPDVSASTRAEELAGTANSADDFVFFATTELNKRITSIYGRTAVQPCSQNCDSNCAFWNGFVIRAGYGQ